MTAASVVGSGAGVLLEQQDCSAARPVRGQRQRRRARPQRPRTQITDDVQWMPIMPTSVYGIVSHHLRKVKSCMLALLFISPAVDASGCFDAHTDCSAWARGGECSRNSEYMYADCRKSCGLCTAPLSSATVSRQASGPALVEGELLYSYGAACAARTLSHTIAATHAIGDGCPAPGATLQCRGSR